MKTFTKLLLIFFLWACGYLELQAQSKSPVKIGNTSEVKAQFRDMAKENKSGKKGQISYNIPGQVPLDLNLKSSRKEGLADFYYGELNNTKKSNFYMKIKGDEVSGSIINRDKKKFYDLSSTANGSVYITEKDLDKVLCVEYQENTRNATTSGSLMEAGVAAVPMLESFPEAEAVVLLDFDGHTVTNTWWNYSFNNGDPIVADPSYLSEIEIVEVWEMMSEDFRPFQLNVTTDEAVYNNAPADRRTRVIFTPTDYFYPGSGGVAYIGSFTWGDDTPCWVFNSGSKYAGEAGSHEVGHTLSLVHDGRSDPYFEEYYYGHDSWAPIMGVGYYTSVVQWSKGEYPNASNTEDDLQMITSYNGFGYRTDDHGNSTENASPLIMDEEGNVSPSSNKGVIATQTDVDVFSFTTSGGSVILNVDPDPSFPNLDILLTLRNSDGSVVATADPYSLAASIDQTLPAGTYYLDVDGVAGSLGANTDYGSLGQYFVSGNIPAIVPSITITSPADGHVLTIPENPINITASVNDAIGIVSKVEFFSGSEKLGEDLTAPYTYSWRQPHKGTYSITARATNTMGDIITSEAVSVTVALPGKGNSKEKGNKKAFASTKASSNDLSVVELAEPLVFPNPVTGNHLVNIALPIGYTAVKVLLNEVGTGQKVSEQIYHDTQSVQLDISALPHGLYAITISAEEEVWTRKLIVLP